MLVISYKDIVCGHDNSKVYVCMYEYVLQSKHAVPYNEFPIPMKPFFPVLPGCWTGLCSSNTAVRIKFFLCWISSHRKRDISFNLYCGCYCFVVTLHKLNLWDKGHKPLFLISV